MPYVFVTFMELLFLVVRNVGANAAFVGTGPDLNSNALPNFFRTQP